MSNNIIFLLKFILITICYLFLNKDFIKERFHHYNFFEQKLKKVGYVAQLLLGTLIISLFASSLLWVKFVFYPIFLVSSIFYVTYYRSTGAPLSFADFLTLFDAKGMVHDAFLAYKDSLLIVALWHIPVTVAYFIFPSLVISNGMTMVAIGLLVVVLSALTLSLYNTQGRGLKGKPAYLIPPVFLLMYIYITYIKQGNDKAFNEKPRPNLEAITQEKSEIKTLIMVIDESINWHLIDLNRDEGNTPSLKLFPKENIINFGPAVAYSNASDLSNASIRKFIRFNEEENDLYGSSTTHIWEVVKLAGFKPYLIDAQGDGFNHNFFTPEESAEFTLLPAKHFKADTEIIDSILAVREKNPDDKLFFLIIKEGSHFPYKNLGFDTPFMPTMASTSIRQSTAEEVYNAYRNRTRFNTDLFFKAIYECFSYQEETVIVYTSDHGQTLANPGEKATHCDTYSPHLAEAMVPLLVVGPEKVINNAVSRDMLDSSQIASHYMIPALLMSYLGYQKDDIQAFTDYKRVLNQEEVLHFVYRRAIPFFEPTAQKMTVPRERFEQLMASDSPHIFE